MSRAMPLAELFRVKARFCRSVDLEADCRDAGALTDYIITPRGREVLWRVGQGLRPGSHARAWSITGPYGAGKSALAAFLARFFTYQQDAQARELLRTTDPELYDELLRGIPGLADGGFMMVPVVGSREPLSLALFRGLKVALGSGRLQGQEVNGTVDWLEQQCERMQEGQEILPMVLTEGIERAARALGASKEKPLGLLIIIDELGKLLEFAALRPEKSDVYHLQTLAELAARSAGTPVGVIAILHQAFEHYAAYLGRTEQQEWAKVQGRYEDIGFLESQGEVLKLIGAAIEAQPWLDGLGRAIAQEVARAERLGIIPRQLGELRDVLMRCAPLHPTVVLLLSRLFHSRLAQNERSLFAFLTSGEPCGLQDHLRRVTWMGGTDRLYYRLDQLYDYVMGALGSGLYQDKKWAEIGDALDRLPQDATALEARLVKAIGLLGVLGNQQHLKASREVLAYALFGRDGVGADQVQGALARLCERGTIIYRQYKQAYGLWEGSDIDLAERFEEGRGQIDRSATTASLLAAHGELRPYVAKRHLHETGTLRYFAPWVIDIDAIEEVTDRPLEPADGAIVFVLGRQGSTAEQVLETVLTVARRLEPHRRQLLFFAVPRDTAGLRAAMDDVLAWKWVARNTPELEGDSIARKELAGRMAGAQRHLDEICNRCFGKGSSYASAVWIWNGQQREVASAADLAKALSDACDRAYYLAPQVHNELVNRRTLSSAAAAARRNLIERMLTAPTERRLGIVGYPAELSMYRSVLERSGLHHRTRKGWEFGPGSRGNQCRVDGLWEEIERFLALTEQGRRSVAELYENLRRPPYGTRDGLLPIYLAVVVLHWDAELALYESGSFIPQPSIAVFERLIKIPERFSIQRYRLGEGRAYLFERYASLLGKVTVGKPTLVTAVRPLLAFYERLPDYSRRTHAVSPAAGAVREAISSAREPYPLLFEDLPGALGMKPLGADAGAATARTYFVELRSALLELQKAYGDLVERIKAALLEAMRLPKEMAAAREEISQRACALQGSLTDPRLGAFVVRLCDMERPGQQWLESIADILTGRPPRHWRDEDVDRYLVELHRLAGQFRRVEEIALQDQTAGRQRDGVRLIRLSVTSETGEEHRDIVPVRPDEETAAREVADVLEEVLQRHETSDGVKAAAVAELVRRALLKGAARGDQRSAG